MMLTRPSLAAVALMALVGAFLINVLSASQQVFHYRQGSHYTAERAKQMLKHNRLTPVEVISLLAQVDYKDNMINGLFIYQIIDMNKYNVFQDCSKSKLKARRRTCDQTKGSIYRYCEHCISHIKQHCRMSPVGVLMSLGKLDELNRRHSFFDIELARNFRPGHPIESNVKQYVHSLNWSDKKSLKRFCSEMRRDLEEQLNYFGMDRTSLMMTLSYQNVAFYTVLATCEAT